jgi:hypothetical protein
MTFVERTNVRREQVMKEYHKSSRIADFTSEVSDVVLEHMAGCEEVPPETVAHEMIDVLEETINNLEKCYPVHFVNEMSNHWYVYAFTYETAISWLYSEKVAHSEIEAINLLLSENKPYKIVSIVNKGRFP